MNIFEISKELESVFDELEENGGELTEELEEKLSISQDEFRSKVDAYLSVIRHTESDIDCCPCTSSPRCPYARNRPVRRSVPYSPRR